jgi:hypothetical protein
MPIRRTALLAAFVALAASLLGPAAPALATTEVPPPLSPDQAQTLATTGTETSGSTTNAVDGATALNASALPESDTAIEGGISPQAAVGLAPLSEGNMISATRPVCWANAMWHQWGTWPYQQRITDTTYWCAVYGNHITYRSSTTTASGTLCAVNWRARQLIAGGVGPGFTYFTMRSSAGFACPTVIPWITLHTTHHEDVKRTARGATTLVGSG